MTDEATILCEWRDGAFHPRGNSHMARAHDTFGEGEVVALTAIAERSMRSHRHQFASLRDLWLNLPETLADMPYALSAETFRKHALIQCGYADCETIDAGSKAAAERIAAYVGGLARKAHGYCIVKVSGPVVRCWTPHSQSVRAMGSATFQKSKTDILEWADALIAGERKVA